MEDGEGATQVSNYGLRCEGIHDRGLGRRHRGEAGAFEVVLTTSSTTCTCLAALDRYMVTFTLIILVVLLPPPACRFLIMGTKFITYSNLEAKWWLWSEMHGQVLTRQ